MLLEPSLGSFVVLDVVHGSAKLKTEPMFAKRSPTHKAEITKIDKRSNPINLWYCILDDSTLLVSLSPKMLKMSGHLTKLPLRSNFAAVSPTCINILLASWCIV